MLRITRSFLCRFRATSILAIAGLWLAASGAAEAQVLSKLAERGFAVVPEPQDVELDGSDVSFGPAYSLQGASADSSGAAADYPPWLALLVMTRLRNVAFAGA